LDFKLCLMRFILSSKSSIVFKKKQGTHLSKNLYFVYISTKRGKVAHKYNLVIDEGRLLLYSELDWTCCISNFHTIGLII